MSVTDLSGIDAAYSEEIYDWMFAIYIYKFDTLLLRLVIYPLCVVRDELKFRLAEIWLLMSFLNYTAVASSAASYVYNTVI